MARAKRAGDAMGGVATDGPTRSRYAERRLEVGLTTEERAARFEQVKNLAFAS